MGFPGGSAGKESTCNVGDLGLIPGLGRTPGEGKGYPLQYSGLENSTDRIVHGFAKSWTRLSNFHFQFLVDSVVSFRCRLSVLHDENVWRPLSQQHEYTSHYSTVHLKVVEMVTFMLGVCYYNKKQTNKI